MNPPGKPPRAKRWARAMRWGSGIVLLALAPKCLLCAAAYLGLGAMLSLAGPELCGAASNAAPDWPWLALGVGIAVLAVFMHRLRPR